MRMKNLQIGYTFPKAWMNKAKIEKLRIYVSGENLFTISGIADMFDPEATAGNGFSNGKTYPLSKHRQTTSPCDPAAVLPSGAGSGSCP